jgi:hypothetical protein
MCVYTTKELLIDLKIFDYEFEIASHTKIEYLFSVRRPGLDQKGKTNI